MARSAYLWITDDPDAPLKEKFDERGGSTVSTDERLGTVECVSFDMSGESFFNSGTGEQTGMRQFQPITIRKQLDNTSPLFWRALSNGWVFTATFKFYDFPPGSETERCCYIITLGKARVVGMRTFLPTTSDETEGNPLPPMEEVKFIFANVSWKGQFGEGVETDTTWNQKDEALA